MEGRDCSLELSIQVASNSPLSTGESVDGLVSVVASSHKQVG